MAIFFGRHDEGVGNGNEPEVTKVEVFTTKMIREMMFSYLKRAGIQESRYHVLYKDNRLLSYLDDISSLKPLCSQVLIISFMLIISRNLISVTDL